ncbi:GFA family protein [Aspergillus saccharolyticus JOP 1030-1]|uniref:CENP-V/GFA domain-containing protein n=1 Tax=Aspergillus saccharolyticus JOP 1030-1 TaxID=1450539 RepID=A0A319AC24_9EURO|nr:hypothetical protein BP01DRAFT_388290 [Aspergillus saccharolyticus JOP 1030-1]PYH49218.1 hypothetical protein BP01DRAFT_388290 [Aspergillus saccharolyticus JOP 1030-1]
MPTGSCFCGAIRLEYTGQPLQVGICHCTDCRKLTSSTYSYCLVLPTANFAVRTGSPRSIAKTADTGNTIRNWFCGDCGTPLYGHRVHDDGRVLGDGVTILRAGVLDDAQLLDEMRPEAELFTERRMKWVGPVEGAGQVCGMLKISS